MRFRTLLLGHHDDRCVERLSTALDRMDPQSRLMTVLSIEPKEQAVLWELMSGRDVDADHFVPSGTEPLQPIIHYGRNTLPVFKFFQKRFCRADDDSGALWGYNAQSLSGVTGPGYFVASARDEQEQPARFVIDYTKIPPKKPSDWPALASNERGMSRLVFGGMTDFVRGVSEHVCIGRAYKSGKAVDAWFILCRQDAG